VSESQGGGVFHPPDSEIRRGHALLDEHTDAYLLESERVRIEREVGGLGDSITLSEGDVDEVKNLFNEDDT
jgi:hypothetical protein